MTGQKENTDRILWMLGLVMTLPVILVSGPLAGYLIALALIKYFALNPYWIPILSMIGLLASGVRTFELIRKLYQTQKQK